jgi:hypothetical protein
MGIMVAHRAPRRTRRNQSAAGLLVPLLQDEKARACGCLAVQDPHGHAHRQGE